MIATTGWTAQELRTQPATLVRSLFWREYAKRLPLAALRSLAAIPAKFDPAHPQESLDQLKTRDDAQAALTALETALWPEDADGDE